MSDGSGGWPWAWPAHQSNVEAWVEEQLQLLLQDDEVSNHRQVCNFCLANYHLPPDEPGAPSGVAAVAAAGGGPAAAGAAV